MSNLTVPGWLPNWRHREEYLNHGDDLQMWAWEFLRRTPEYQEDYQSLAEMEKEAACRKAEELGGKWGLRSGPIANPADSRPLGGWGFVVQNLCDPLIILHPELPAIPQRVRYRRFPDEPLMDLTYVSVEQTSEQSTKFGISVGALNERCRTAEESWIPLGKERVAVVIDLRQRIGLQLGATGEKLVRLQKKLGLRRDYRDQAALYIRYLRVLDARMKRRSVTTKNASYGEIARQFIDEDRQAGKGSIRSPASERRLLGKQFEAAQKLLGRGCLKILTLPVDQPPGGHG